MAGYGYLGGRIAALLRGENFGVTVITRSVKNADTHTTRGSNFICCNLARNAPALQLHEFDAAVFCLAPGQRAHGTEAYKLTYCDAQRNFLQAFSARYYVFISSTAVYPDAPGNYDEAMAAAHSERAEILLAAEQIALAQKNSCVLRLAGLYSAERPIYRHETVYARDKLVHFIHREDAARAAVHAVKKQLTGIYNVHDGHPQLRSTILNSQRAGQLRAGAAATRLLDCGKIFASGFNVMYADYFAGIQEVQN